MARLREVMPDYQNYLDLGMSKDEVRNVAKSRAKLQKQRDTIKPTLKPIQEETPEQSTREYLKTSDDVLPQLSQGLVTNFGRAAKLLNATTGVEIPKYKELVSLTDTLNQQKEKRSMANVTPQRREEKDILNQKTQNAKGFVENLGAGVDQMVDVASHPSEWTVQGTTEFIADPTNAISLGVGKIVTKGILSPLYRAMVGGVAGGSEAAIVNSAIEYGVARGEGKSVEEAKKIAIQSASGGALVGTALGSVGGAMPNAKSKARAKAKEDMKGINDPTKVADMENDFGFGEKIENAEIIRDENGNIIESTSTDLEVQSTNRLFDIVESELKAHETDIQIKQLTTELVEQGISDPAIIEARIESSLKPTQTDILITQAINSGADLPNSYKGVLVLTKIENTIINKLADPTNARPPEDIFNKLKSIGASDELASIFTEAYAKGDYDVASNWYADKIKESLAIEAKEIQNTSKDIESISKDTQSIPLEPKIVKEGKLIDDVTNVKEDVTYQTPPADQITTSFKAGDGYQFRSDKQGNVIKDITENFDSDRHFGSDGGYDGLPVVDSKGKVLVGNHRVEAIKNMNPQQLENYTAKMKEKYPDAGDGIMVRVLKDDANAQTVAKVSNDRRVKADSEKIILQGAKHKEALTNLPQKIDSEVALKNLVGASDELESNQAMLGHLTNDKLPYAVDRYMKQNPQDLNFKQMFYKNAYKLYNLSNIAKKDGFDMLEITPLLDRSIDKITNSKADKKSNLNGIIEFYNEQLKSGGKDLEGNTISSKEFAADILGAALKHYKTLKDDGISEFGKRIDQAINEVKDSKQPDLFGGERTELSLVDVALTFLNESDRARMDIQDLKNRIEENEINHADNGVTTTTTTDPVVRSTSSTDGADGISKGSDSRLPTISDATKQDNANPTNTTTKTTAQSLDKRQQSTEVVDKSSDGTWDRLPVSEKRREATRKINVGYEALPIHRDIKIGDIVTSTLHDGKKPLEVVDFSPDRTWAEVRQEGASNTFHIRNNEILTSSKATTKPDTKSISKDTKSISKDTKSISKDTKEVSKKYTPQEQAKIDNFKKEYDIRKAESKRRYDAGEMQPREKAIYELNNQKHTKELAKTVDDLEKQGKISTLLYEDVAKIIENKADRELQISFSEKLDAPTKKILWDNNFKYNIKKKVWRKPLYKDTIKQAKAVVRKIKGLKLDKENC